MIGVFYIGDNRHNLALARSNHQPLLDGLQKFAQTNVYDFTKGYPERGTCPFDEGGEDTRLQRGASGAVQVWDFATSVDRLTEEVVIKMRTDVWLTESSTKVVLAHVKDILKGHKDIVFFGADIVNDNQGVEHKIIEITNAEPDRIQDFIIVARRSCLQSTPKIVKDLQPQIISKRVSGNKTFKTILAPAARAYTVLCHMWLIRKTYYWTPTDGEVFRDFVQKYQDDTKLNLFQPALNWWKQKYTPSIGVFYIGHRRFAEVGFPNHATLMEKLKKLLPINVYDFSKTARVNPICPFAESGAIQVWDFMQAVSQIKDEFIIKLRSDVWFTPSSIDCVVDGMQQIIEGKVDAEFYGSNWTDYLGHESTRISLEHHTWVQDFVVSARKSILDTKENVNQKLQSFKPGTRLCGTKVYKSIIHTQVKANNVQCQLYLIRKHYRSVDPWQVGYDYLKSYPKQWKMPRALPWYLSTKNET